MDRSLDLTSEEMTIIAPEPAIEGIPEEIVIVSSTRGEGDLGVV